MAKNKRDVRHTSGICNRFLSLFTAWPRDRGGDVELYAASLTFADILYVRGGTHDKGKRNGPGLSRAHWRNNVLMILEESLTRFSAGNALPRSIPSVGTRLV